VGSGFCVLGAVLLLGAVVVDEELAGGGGGVVVLLDGGVLDWLVCDDGDGVLADGVSEEEVGCCVGCCVCGAGR
jgi:hypothetical protein